jgi:hypothetical protein
MNWLARTSAENLQNPVNALLLFVFASNLSAGTHEGAALGGLVRERTRVQS